MKEEEKQSQTDSPATPTVGTQIRDVFSEKLDGSTVLELQLKTEEFSKG